MTKVLLAIIFLLCTAHAAHADGILIPEPWVPISIKYHRVTVDIRDQVATTHIDQVFKNDTKRGNIEGVYIFPVPEGATVSAFSMYVDGERLDGDILKANEARRIYEEIVRKQIDPALLEYAGREAYRARIFPIDAEGEKRVELSYDQIVRREGGVCQYVYPLNTEKFSSKPLHDASVTVHLRSSEPIKSIYSPSHEIAVERKDDYTATVIYADEDITPDQDFVLYYTVSQESVGLNLLTYREAGADGFYLLLASPKVEVDESEIVRKRVIFGLDTSSSMRKDMKIEQARAALKVVLNNLNEGDEFNIVNYATTVEQFSRDGAVPADADHVASALEYVDGLLVGGGTNIDGALQTALSSTVDDELTNILIFLTDGKPTIGETDTGTILEHVKTANSNETRIFVFGVGFEVNTHLLDQLASDNHGLSTYVKPDEDIEIEVSAFYNKISNPVLSNLHLDFGTIETSDAYPASLPDLFQGSQIVQLGRYAGDGDVAVILSGEVNGNPRTFAEDVSFPSEDESNDFIPRLWATRKIGYLLDQIRLNGEDPELVEEIVSLSKRYGLITPYTSFLIVEDEAVPPPNTFDALTRDQVGEGAVKVSEEVHDYSKAETANEVQSTEIRYVGNKTFFLRDGFWLDSIVQKGEPTVDYTYGSDRYFSLIASNPQLGRYLALGKNVIVRYEGTTYRIGEHIVDVEKEETGSLHTPEAFELSPSFPNPFNATTVIQFQVPGTGDGRSPLLSVELAVYDLLGRRIRTLMNGQISPGTYAATWDGKDDGNREVSSGVYVVRLMVDGKGAQARKAMLLR